MATFSGAGVGARAGMAMKANRGFMKPLSKAAEIGGNYRMIIPTYNFTNEEGKTVGDILVGFGAGRDVDFNVFGTTFMMYRKDWYEDDNGRPKCKIGCDQFNRISKAILEAQCNSEKEAAKKEADELAVANNGNRNEVALIRKLDRIDEKYHGREAEEGTQRTYATVSPMVGRLDYIMVAEVLLVPMDSTTNTPQWDKAVYTYKKLPNSLLDQWFKIMDTQGFYNPEDGYLELAFTYGSVGQDKARAGQAATYNGVAENLRLATAFVDTWNKYGAAKVKDLINGKRDLDEVNELILKRTGYNPGAMSAEDARSKLLKWVSKNTIILTHIDVTDDATKKAAKDMIQLGVVDGISTVKQKLMDIVETQGDVDTEDSESTPTAATPAEPVTSMDEAAQQMVAGAPEEPSSDLTAQASSMINSGADIGGRTAQNVQLAANEDVDDELGDLL